MLSVEIIDRFRESVEKGCRYKHERIQPGAALQQSVAVAPESGDQKPGHLFKACIGARAVLGELKQAGGLLPNPTILINTIPLLEVRTSSATGDMVTTTDRLFRYRALAWFSIAQRAAAPPGTSPIPPCSLIC